MREKFEKTTNITLENLICISNIKIELHPIDTVCTKYDNINSIITVTGETKDPQKYIGQYLVVGDEIVKVLSITNITETVEDKEVPFSNIKVEREQFGTRATETLELKHCRLVEVLGINGADVLSYNFTDGMNLVSNSLFGVEVSTGTLTITDDFSKWSPLSKTRLYDIKSKKNVVYIFKGQNNELRLMNTVLTDRVKFNNGTTNEFKRITIPLKNMLFKWFNTPINSKQSLASMTPKTFFMKMFGLLPHEVLYVNGCKEEDIIKCSHIPLSEFKTYSELLKSYCENTAIRFTFDKFERVKVFSDIKVKDLTIVDTFDSDISNIVVDDDSKLVFNSFKTGINQYQTLYRFSDLDNSYVNYKMVIKNAFSSKSMLLKGEEGYYPNIITIESNDMFEKCYLGDYVLAKCTWDKQLEFHGKVMKKVSPNRLELQFFRWDKDYVTLVSGKEQFLNDILNSQDRQMDLYYLRYELPDVFRFSRNRSGVEKDYQLMYPILPMVDGKIKYADTVGIKFGSASNIQNAEYSGSIEGIEGIYGDWDNTKLLYNMELTQFRKGENYPPIFVLSNKVSELVLGNSKTFKYTTFDNQDIKVRIEKNESKDTDAKLTIYNTSNITENQIKTDIEIARIGNSILEVRDITLYSIGDVLTVQKPTDEPTDLELQLFDNTLKHIKWVVKNTWTEQIGEDTHHYILVDSPFAKRDFGKKYKFNIFPVSSIVYLQELSIKGNPLLKSTQEVAGVNSELVNGYTSIDLYEEKPYNLSHSLIDKNEVKKLMGYILYNFGGMTEENTKYSLPIELFNALHIETLDIITINDPNFSKITSDSHKWLVLSTRKDNTTNNVTLSCMNINSSDTKPYELQVKDVLEFKPVEIPKYTNTGIQEDIGDGNSDSEKNEDIGQIWVSKIDESELTAVVDKVERGLIYFTGFKGTKKEQYTNKMMKKGVDFVIEINGEMIFCEAVDSYSVLIKRRGLYNTTIQEIIPNLVVKFLSLTLHTDVDGTIYGRKIHIGDNSTFFHYDITQGAVFKGKFQIDGDSTENNNDLVKALKKNATYKQATKPIGNHLSKGDLWINTSENNKLYVFNGIDWEESSYNSQYYTSEYSKIKYSNTVIENNIMDKDFLIRYDLNKIYLRKDSVWNDFTGKNIVDTDGRKIYHSTNSPTNVLEGTIWFDSANGNIRYVYKEGKWVDTRGKIVSETLKDSRIFITNKMPNWKVEDIWINPTNMNVFINPNVDTNLLEKSTIKNEKTIYFSKKVPKENLKSFDLWVDLDNDFKIYYYENLKWNVTSNNIYDYIDLKTKETANETVLNQLESFTSTITQGIENLKKQLDGAVEIWFNDSEPTEFNYPAVDWTSVTIKQTHVGDLYYTKEGKIYRWVKKGYNYQWESIQDKDIQKALEKASKAQDTADGKRKVFVNEPTPPYNVGDLWLKNQELFVSIKDVPLSGVFNNSHWITATKYTDDSKLNQFKNEITPKLADFQNQIDGKIQTHSGNFDPSTHWDSTEKTKHRGDIWYNTSDKSLYRWLGNQWEKMESNGEDSVARQLAEKRATVFTQQPTPPYNVGDLWLKNQELYICIKSKKETEDYNHYDWKQATNYIGEDKLTQSSEEILEKLNAEKEKQFWINKMVNAKLLYSDVEFEQGENSIEKYADTGSSLVSLELQQRDRTMDFYPPNSTGKVIKVTKKRGRTSPNSAGITFKTQSRRNAIFITKLVANIPKGYKLEFHTNNTGGEGLSKWLTSNQGQGTYEDYLYIHQCGNSTIQEDYKLTNYFTLKNETGSDYSAVEWYIGYATVFDCYSGGITDLTNINNLLRQEQQRLTELQKKYEDTVQNMQTMKTELTGNLDSYKSIIQQGNVVINKNTVFDGSANFVSKGTNQRVEIHSGGINFYRTKDNVERKISQVRNKQSGIVYTNHKGTGTIVFNGLQEPLIVTTSIKAINLGANMASIYCYYKRLESNPPTYQFFLGATNEHIHHNTPIVTKEFITSIKGVTSINVYNSKVDFLEGLLNPDSGDVFINLYAGKAPQGKVNFCKVFGWQGIERTHSGGFIYRDTHAKNFVPYDELQNFFNCYLYKEGWIWANDGQQGTIPKGYGYNSKLTGDRASTPSRVQFFEDIFKEKPKTLVNGYEQVTLTDYELHTEGGGRWKPDTTGAYIFSYQVDTDHWTPLHQTPGSIHLYNPDIKDINNVTQGTHLGQYSFKLFWGIWGAYSRYGSPLWGTPTIDEYVMKTPATEVFEGKHNITLKHEFRQQKNYYCSNQNNQYVIQKRGSEYVLVDYIFNQNSVVLYDFDLNQKENFTGGFVGKSSYWEPTTEFTYTSSEIKDIESYGEVYYTVEETD